MLTKLTMSNLRAAVVLFILTLCVGITVAIGCISFHLLIEFFTQIFFGINDKETFISTVTQLSTFERVLIPTLGGLLVGIILTYLHVADAEGEGVPQVLRAVIFKKSRIRFLVAPIKIVTTALTLGSGGSAGREGPIVQIGSALGSAIGQLARQNESVTKLLLAAGAAAGIGGTFGAPISGVLFSLELILKSVTVRAVLILTLAAVVSDQIASQVLGYDGLRLLLPSDMAINGWLLFISVFLGMASGVVAIYFGRTIRLGEYVFGKLSLPLFVKTAIGGFLVGGLSLYFPYIHEPATYPLMIDLFSVSTLPILFLVGLLFVKILATAITISSGSSGGILAPALLTGLIFGYVSAVALAFLGMPATSIVSFGLIGMAGVFAGVTHAPITATALIYEITSELTVIPVVLIAALTSYFMAKYLHKESVYTEHLSKRRIV